MLGIVAEIAISVQAAPADLQSWLQLARQLESAGFSALLAGDHPAAGPSPWPALGCAAAVTSTLQLGMIGSHEQMADQLLAQAGHYGITSYVVREPAISTMEAVLAPLARLAR